MGMREGNKSMDLRRITLAHLRAFVAIAELGSFTDAGKARLRSQSALTRQIRDLETIVGDRLLDRTRGHLTGLTPTGQRLLPYARQVLSTLDEASCEMARSLTGLVRVGVMDDFEPDLLLGLIERFSAAFPHCTLAVVSDDSRSLLERMARREIDIAAIKRLATIDVNPGPDVLLRVGLRWVAVGLPRLLPGMALPLVLLGDGCVFRERVLDTLTCQSVPFRIAYEGRSYANLRSAVAAGLGITALTDDQMKPMGAKVVERIGDVVLPDLGYVDVTIAVAKPDDSLLVRALERELSLFARSRFERAYGEPSERPSEPARRWSSVLTAATHRSM